MSQDESLFGERGGAALPRISLLEADPELLAHLPEAEADRARRVVTVPLIVLDGGQFDPGTVLAEERNAFGALIMSGLVAREVSLGAQPTLRLLGPGDIIHTKPLAAGLLQTDEVWSASLPTRLAVLDDRFLNAVRRWPRLATALFERSCERGDATLIQVAVSHHARVEDRLADLFAALAESWGRVTPQGVSVPLSLTHEALARLVGARRPTVTLALKQLAEEGSIVRRDDGAWLVRPSGDRADDKLLAPLTGRARPTLVVGPEVEQPHGPMHATPSVREVVVRARALQAGQPLLRARSLTIVARTEQVRERSRALLEEVRARRAEASATREQVSKRRANLG